MPRTLLNKRAISIAYWIVPSLICLWLHRDGLHAWFQGDDFAWLGATTEIHDARSFLHALIRPAAQGTLRPLSERLFFLAFWHWFGWNALPYRGFVLLNQCVNLVLITALVRRASGSAVAAFLAPILWMANAATVTPMAWSSSYNEILCTTFLLSALLLWIRFCDTQLQRYFWWQLAVFILGFGALELNIIYPVLAAAWTILYRRRVLVWTAPLFAISACYYAMHAALVAFQPSGPYKPHVDVEMIGTLYQYWKLSFLPPFGFITVQPVLATALLGAATFGIAIFLFTEVRAGRRAAAFFACWFLIVLAPLLPFRDHITHYYLTIPLAGLAAVGALALARWKSYAAPVVALYLAVQVPLLLVGERWFLDRSRAARALITGVRQVHAWEPAKAILLTDVSKDLYGIAVADNPFRLMNGARVYLAPEAETRLTDLAPNLAPASIFTLPAGATRQALLDRQLVVYSAAATPLLEITPDYMAQVLAAPEPELPHRVDAGSPLLAYLLGPEWYPPEGAYRWMPRRASLRMAGPRSASERLYVSGFVRQPLTLTVTVDGVPAGSAALDAREEAFTREFALPPGSVGKPAIAIVLKVNRTFGRDRELGLVFGVFEIR